MSEINVASSAGRAADEVAPDALAVRSQGDEKTPAPIDSTFDVQEGNVFGFRYHDRRVVKVIMTLLLLWLSVEWLVVATRRPDPLLLQRGAEFRTHFRVHVNDSHWVDWLQLDGIGPSLSHRIVADRKVNGPFSSIEDVARVPGIGPETLDRIRPWLTMGHDANEPRSSTDAPQRSSEQQPATSERQSKAL